MQWFCEFAYVYMAWKSERASSVQFTKYFPFSQVAQRHQVLTFGTYSLDITQDKQA